MLWLHPTLAIWGNDPAYSASPRGNLAEVTGPGSLMECLYLPHGTWVLMSEEVEHSLSGTLGIRVQGRGRIPAPRRQPSKHPEKTLGVRDWAVSMAEVRPYSFAISAWVTRTRGPLQWYLMIHQTCRGVSTDPTELSAWVLFPTPLGDTKQWHGARALGLGDWNRAQLKGHGFPTKMRTIDTQRVVGITQ